MTHETVNVTLVYEMSYDKIEDRDQMIRELKADPAHGISGVRAEGNDTFSHWTAKLLTREN